ncbi:hypothetical protein [Streptomyces canus]|uniref:hypothetical protein n=1 Tax=Streptomyces canus TaxID=58343 RepID=UPI0038660C5F
MDQPTTTPLVDDEGRSFGVIVLVWADPVGWAAKSARARHRCKSLVAELSRALLQRGGLPPRRHFPGVPRFILAPPTGEDALLESVSLSLVYQIGRLAAELSQAPGLRDVVETAIARIMEPFGARCLAISVVDEGRPRLLGYEGAGPALAARLVHASTGTLEEETISRRISSARAGASAMAMAAKRRTWRRGTSCQAERAFTVAGRAGTGQLPWSVCS